MLLPVVLLITLLAVVGIMVNHEGALGTQRVASSLEAQRADYVAQAGLNHVRWQLADDECGPFANVPTTPLGTDSYSATVTTVPVTQTKYSLDPARDAWLWESAPDNNFGGDAELKVKNTPSDSMRAVYFFDLSAFAPGTRLASAKLKLHVNVYDDVGKIDIHRLTKAWLETDATWNTLAAEFDPQVFASIAPQNASDFVELNFTAQAQALVNDPAGNHGIILIANSDNRESTYTSREAQKAPSLKLVTADAVVSTVAVSSTGTLATGVTRDLTRSDVTVRQPLDTVFLHPDEAAATDTYLYEWKPSWNYGVNGEIWVENRYANSIARGLLRFELGTVPVGAYVRRAVLDLYQTNASLAGGPVGVRRITRAWDEGAENGGTGAGANWTESAAGAPWSSYGGDYDDTSFGTVNVPAGTTGAVSLDITDLVAGWVSGTFPNHGALLTAESFGTAAHFASSSATDPGRRPKLTVEYACECGRNCLMPQGKGIVLMLVGDDSVLTPRDQVVKALMESWGYTVDLANDNTSASGIQSAMDTRDVLYVADSVNVTTIGTKLTTLPAGVVSGKSELATGLGFAAGQAWLVGDSVDVVDTSHYITLPFAGGPLDIYDGAMEVATLSGAVSPDGQTLATVSSASALATLDVGGALAGGGTAPARRVALPFGRGQTFNWDYVNSNGRLLLQRALAWGAGADTGGGGGGASGTIILSTESGATLGGLTFTDKDLAEYDPATDTATLFLDGVALGLANDIDAVHVLPNGHIVLSAINTITLGGVNAENEDLVDYDPVTDTGTLMFDGSALFTSGSTDISAVHVLDNGHLLLTNEYTATLGGLSFGPNDIIDYDPVADTATMFFDGDAVGFTDWINAVHLLANGNVVLSTNTATTLGGLSFNPGDLVEYDISTDTAMLYFDGTLFSAAENVRSAHITGDGGTPFGPIAHWKLDDGSGPTAVDSEGGHDGTRVGDPAWVTGLLDGALDFDGVDDYVDVGTFDVSGSGLTLMGWFNAETIPTSDGRIISKASSPNDFDAWWQLSTTDSGSNRYIRMRIKAGGTTTTLADSSVNLTTGRWYFAVGTYDNATGEMKLYLDGAEVRSASHAVGGAVDAGPTVPVAIGANGTAERFFDGVLDDVRVYDRALSATEIADLYAAGLSGPIAHWKLDETSGYIAVDSAGGHDGTVVIDPPTWTPGTIDGGLDFDGIDDYVDAGTFDVTGSGLTLMAWFNGNAFPANGTAVISKSEGNSETDIWWQLSTTDDGANRYLRFRIKAAGTTTRLDDTSTDLNVGRWYFAVATYDNSGSMRLYIDGTEVASGTHAVGGPVDPGPTVPVEIGVNLTPAQFFDGILDDVRVYDRALSAAEIADLYTAGGGGGPSGPGYVEMHQPWTASTPDNWETVDLGAFGVPANAVVEVAVINTAVSAQRWGGVRAVVSSLDRRLLLHEAEAGGADAVTLHVQVDGSSQIQHYSDNTGQVSFVLLGYWTGATYVEAFATFKAGGSGSWLEHDLGAHGVGPNQVAEIVMVNTSTSNERLAGVRPSGATYQRHFSLHEAESGGVDALSILVETDASSIAEVYAASNTDVDFYVVGYWSTPPGTYTEATNAHGSVSSSATWEPTDLTSFSVPGGAVAQFIITNDGDTAEQNMGVREMGSPLSRLLDLQEAEAGGSDAASMHVNVDGSSQVQWYSESGTTDRYFYPIGWWVIP